MGIRFTCPNGHRLHVKAELAGKRGICPECQARVQIPTMAEAEAQGAVEPDGESAPRAAAAPPPAPALAPVAVAPAAPSPPDVWFVRNAAGEQWGPATAADVRTALAAGRLDDAGWAWRTGWPDWKPIGEVRSLIGAERPRGPTDASPVEAVVAASAEPAAAAEPPLPQPAETLAERLHLTPTTTPAARPSRWQRRRRRQWLTLLLGLVTIVLAAVLGVVLNSR